MSLSRFVFLIHSALKAIRTTVNHEERDWHLRLENDAFTLNLFTTLLVSVPQIILQVYTVAILQHLSVWISK